MKSGMDKMRKYIKRPICWLLLVLIIIMAITAYSIVVRNRAENIQNKNSFNKRLKVKQSQSINETVGLNIEARLDRIIAAGPKNSSNPYDYVKNNKDFEQIVAMGQPALDYMLDSFAKGYADGLREYVMACACARIMGTYNDKNGIAVSSGRDWFYKYGNLERDDTFGTVDADYDEFKSGPNAKGTKILLPDSTNTYDMNDVIGKYILARNRRAYMNGEKAIESHIFCGRDQSGDVMRVYMQMSFGWFGFENGVFTQVSGCGAIPLKMTLQKSSTGEYRVLEYREPTDGSGWSKSIRDMFPPDLADMFSKDNPRIRKELWDKQVVQAKGYLKTIGRDDAPVLTTVDKKSPDESAGRAIYYVTQMKKSFPDWNGSKEVLVRTGGSSPGSKVRCVLETRCIEESKGKYTVTLTEKWGLNVNGTPVKSFWKYCVAGERVRLLESQDQDYRIQTIK